MRCESGRFQAESEGDGIEQERFIEIGEPCEHRSVASRLGA